MRIKQMKKICFITEPHRRIIGSVVLRTRRHADYVLDINDSYTDWTAEGDIVNGIQYLDGNVPREVDGSGGRHCAIITWESNTFVSPPIIGGAVLIQIPGPDAVSSTHSITHGYVLE